VKHCIIITTIHPKSEAISVFEAQPGWHVVTVGDKKSAAIPSSANLTFLSLAAQAKLDFRLARECPFNHYARKNIGYLYAIRSGAEVIFDTDDDNTPNSELILPTFACDHQALTVSKFVNIFTHFTREFVWPRGFPFDEIQNARRSPFRLAKTPAAKIGVWQGLSDGEPDVDALFRLVLNHNIRFSRKKAFFLPPGRFCPVNSQNSFWQRRAFPYLYLPATVSFRFTDILRGYVLQRLLWQDGLHVGVAPAAVGHLRNPHDLMKDFADEVPFLLHIKEIVAIIESVKLGVDPWANLFGIYEKLTAANFVGRDEMELLGLWQEAFMKIER